MIVTLALILIATAGGVLATYLYDESAPMAARLCAGAATGLAALGLLGFLFASLMGLAPLSIALAALAVASPLALLKNGELRAAVGDDLNRTRRWLRQMALHPSWSETGYFVYYVLVAALLWLVFRRALFELPEGLYTGVQNNYGDLPFHLSVINGFARGENFPPQDPTYAGARFTYPFIVDFVAAMFVRVGASLRDAMLMENFVLALSFVGLLHRWTLRLVRDRLAAAIAPVLVLFSGGLGFLRFLREVRLSSLSLFDYLTQLSQQYTIGAPGYRWGNALTTLLVPQRGILFGLPLALVVLTLFWQLFTDTGSEEDERGAALPDNETEDAGAQRRSEAAKTRGKTKKEKQARKSAATQSAALRAATAAAAAPRLRVPVSPLLRVSPLRRMIAAGAVAGLLPLIHAHTFMVVLMVGGLLCVLRQDWRAWAAGLGALALLTAGLAYLSPSTLPGAETPFVVKAYAGCAVAGLGAAAFVWLLRGPHWRAWLAFFVVAFIIAAPQLLFATRGSSVEATTFIGWHFGWDHGDESVWRFWLKNTGLFMPLLLLALTWRWERPLVQKRLVYYYLPFTLCFIIPNLILLAPWVWDNIKVLFFWYVASVPLVALLLARLWRSGWWLRGAAAALLLGLTMAGALDVWSVVASDAAQYQEFDREGVKFAAAVEQNTRPRALVLHAPTFNHPVFLTGRQSVMGYPGHIWTHGLKYQDREAMIKRIYAGGPDTAGLLAGAGVEYVVVSPLELQLMPVNEAFFAHYPLAASAGAYRLYKVK